jgi:hypothetical protein
LENATPYYALIQVHCLSTAHLSETEYGFKLCTNFYMRREGEKKKRQKKDVTLKLKRE